MDELRRCPGDIHPPLRKWSPVPLPQDMTIYLMRRFGEFPPRCKYHRILKSPPVQGDGTVRRRRTILRHTRDEYSFFDAPLRNFLNAIFSQAIFLLYLVPGIYLCFYCTKFITKCLNKFKTQKTQCKMSLAQVGRGNEVASVIAQMYFVTSQQCEPF